MHSQDEQPRCYICNNETSQENSFSIVALYLLRASNPGRRNELERKLEEEQNLPDQVTVHTTCIDDPKRLDWPEYSAFRDWALSVINQQQRQLDRLQEKMETQP